MQYDRALRFLGCMISCHLTFILIQRLLLIGVLRSSYKALYSTSSVIWLQFDVFEIFSCLL